MIFTASNPCILRNTENIFFKKKKKPTTAEIIDQIFRDEIFKIFLNSLNYFFLKKKE